MNERTPVDGFIIKSAASVPEMDQVFVEPASTSFPVKVVMTVAVSATEMAYVEFDELVVIVGASLTSVIVIVTV